MERSKRGYGITGFRTGSGALLVVMACLMLTGSSVFGQFGQGNRPITRAQEAIRTRIQTDLTRDANVFFNTDVTERSASNVATRVTGTGIATRTDGARRTFTYDVTVNRRSGDVIDARYDWRGNWDGGSGPGFGNRPGGPGGGWSGDARQVARDAVLNQIQNDYGSQATATINTTDLYNLPGSDQGVRGRGQMRSGRQRVNFTYDVRIDNRRGRVEEGSITFQDGRTSYIGNNRPGGGGRPPGGGNWPPGGGAGGGWGGTRPPGAVQFRGAITNENSGKSLDVAGESREDGANVQQWDYARQDNQEWEIINVGRNNFAIVNRNSNRVLDVADTNLNDDGGNVQQYRWSGRDNQRWRLESVGGGLYRIINVASGRCLDVDDKSRSNGANVHQWRCNNERSQRWRISN